MQKRFRGLSVMAVIVKIVGGFNLAVSFISLILLPLIFSQNDGLLAANLGLYNAAPGTGLIGGFAAGVVIFIVAGLIGIIMIAVGGMIDVLIAVEENTRAVVILAQTPKSE
jgi:hypothetical protein